MRRLAAHYGRFRNAYPADQLLIVFDIDGTILDMRHMVRHMLPSFDRAHGSDWFHDLTADDVTVHENQVDQLLQEMALPAPVAERAYRWYLEQRWQPEAVVAAHRPYQGVLDVIRWFQIQPDTSVALNTGRPEHLRAQTLQSARADGVARRQRRVEPPPIPRVTRDLGRVRPARRPARAAGAPSRLVRGHAVARRGAAAAAPELVDAFGEHDRGLKLDLKQPDHDVLHALELIDGRLPEDRLWFNATIESLGEPGFRELAANYPTAIRQCPIDFLAPLVFSAPGRAKDLLDKLDIEPEAAYHAHLLLFDQDIAVALRSRMRAPIRSARSRRRT
jgi:hypothetical protein